MSTTPTTIAQLAAEHDARTLAAALVERLAAEGRREAVAAVVAVLSGEAVGIIDPTPPYPRTGN
jgi:hypothetical protein